MAITSFPHKHYRKNISVEVIIFHLLPFWRRDGIHNTLFSFVSRWVWREQFEPEHCPMELSDLWLLPSIALVTWAAGKELLIPGAAGQQKIKNKSSSDIEALISNVFSSESLGFNY